MSRCQFIPVTETASVAFKSSESPGLQKECLSLRWPLSPYLRPRGKRGVVDSHVTSGVPFWSPYELVFYSLVNVGVFHAFFDSSREEIIWLQSIGDVWLNQRTGDAEDARLFN